MILKSLEPTSAASPMANFESFRAVVSERFNDHKRSIIEGADETAELKKRVRRLELQLSVTEAKLEYAIERLGGERAVAINGQIWNADTVPKDIHLQDIQPQFTPICFRAIRPTRLSIQVGVSSSRLRVVQQGRCCGLLSELLTEIGNTLVELNLHFVGGTDGSGKYRLNLPALPKLKCLSMHNFGGYIENADCLEGLKTTSPGLEGLVGVNTQVIIPTLPPGTIVQWH